MNVEEILVRELREMNADGLYNSAGPCGCGIDDLAPCKWSVMDFPDPFQCIPAKRGKDGLYYPMGDK